MKKGIMAIGLLTCATIAIAQTDVNHHVPGIHEEGVTYFLPQTVIDITIEAEKVTYTPGLFCNYANKYLRLQGISNTSETYWDIKDIFAQTNGIPNPQNGYTIKLKEKSIASLVELTSDGILVSINRKQKDAPVKQQAVPNEPKLHIDPKDILGEEILTATSTAKMAELVAKEIYNIRESRNTIIRGQAENMPKDGESLKIILRNLEAQDEALTNMFKGTTIREKKTIALRLIPGEEAINKLVLCRFSKKLGIVSSDDLSGTPIYYDLENLYPISVQEESSGKKSKKPQGVVCNIPGKARFKVYNNQEVFLEEEFPIAQFGQTDILSNDLFNKTSSTCVIFDPATGAVLKIDRE